jgi:hypothetical protein
VQGKHAPPQLQHFCVAAAAQLLAERLAGLARQPQLQLRVQQQSQQHLAAWHLMHCSTWQHQQPHHQQQVGLLLLGVHYSLTPVEAAVAWHDLDPCLSGPVLSGLAMSGWTLQAVLLLLLLLLRRKLAAGRLVALVL